MAEVLMAQFDLFRHARNKRSPLLLDIQADLLRDLATRIVAPLTPVKRGGAKPISRLNPVVTIDGAEYAILFQELAAVPVRGIGAAAGNLRDRRDELIGAL